MPTASTPPLDLAAALTQAAGQVSSASELSPELVLDLDSNEVGRLRQLAQQQTAASVTHWPPLPAAVAEEIGAETVIQSSSGAILVLHQETGSRVRGGIARAIARNRAPEVAIVVESLPSNNPDDSLLRGKLDQHLLLLLPAPGSPGELAQIAGGRWFVSADRPQRGRGLLRIGDEVVARIRQGAVELFVHPFLSADGTLTAARPQARANFFNELVALAAPHFPEVFRRQRELDSEQVLAEAVATIDMLPGFVRALEGSIDERRRQAERRLSDSLQQIGSARTRLVTQLRSLRQTEQDSEALARASQQFDDQGQAVATRASQLTEAARLHREQASQERQRLLDVLRQQGEIREEIDQLSRAADAASIENLSIALTEIMRIRRLGPVRQVSLNAGEVPEIDITLHPVVIEHRSQRYLLDRLRFTLPLNGQAHPRWHGLRQNGSPHPHVSSTDNTCWGQAGVPLGNALRARQFSTAVVLICGWARLYNAASPYVALENFPTTNLEPGWHPEVPVNA